MRAGSLLRRTPGTGRLTALAAGLALAAGALVGVSAMAAGAATTPVAVHSRLSYACHFPSGTRQLAVTITASLPSVVVAGRPVRPAGFRLTLTLFRPLIASLARVGAAEVTGSALLSPALAPRPAAPARPWPSRTRAPAALPPTGSLTLTMPGPAAAFTEPTTGTATVRAARLALTLTPLRAGGGQGRPAALAADCVPAPGQRTALAVIRVTAAATASPTQPGAPGRTRPVASRQPPPGCATIGVKAPQISCGYLTGYADVTKLNGAALLQPAAPAKPGLVSIAENVRIKQAPGAVFLYNVGQLYYLGHTELPPVRATFLAFRFMPITATLQITELKPISIIVKLYRTVLVQVTVSTEISLRIYGATVNGLPWTGLGTSCQTSRPVQLTLTGHGDTATQTGYWNLAVGGPLSGMVDIPPFTHCGVTENLDPLFSASISGPGNFNLMTQGPLCFARPYFASTCPPAVPAPIR